VRGNCSKQHDPDDRRNCRFDHRCCLPHGVVSLVFAIQVNKKTQAGDIDDATNAAKQAKMFGWISIILGVIGFVVWCFVIGFSAIMAAVSNR
jgi:hypothetical protein